MTCNPTITSIYTRLGQIEATNKAILDIITNIPANNVYNINESFTLEGTTTITLPANTYHAYSVVVLQGNVDITEGSVTIQNASQGYSGGQVASTKFTNPVIFVGNTSDTVVIIKTIK